jgi:hypothetical protein
VSAGRRIAALSVALASCVAADARAQTCAGGISFNFAPLQLGVAAARSGRGVAASASLAYGSDRLFAAGSGLVADGGRASRAGVTVGVDQAVRRDNRLHVCPTVTASYARSDGERRADVGAHIASGWVARNRPGLVVVPAFGVSIGNGAASAVGVRADRVTGAVDAAVGIIVRSRYAFTPRVIVGWRRGEMVIAAAMGFTIHVGHE